ncbi:DsbA family protein [Pseudovibrio sp. Tun.PSC04-5.I4]|uniref:DsbA family protein n=1 Tax=Pseudovibrio sp. Tun.PSC04-5.I4 TaxID=1798213 RepID=UPI00088C81E4|nr:DsbA family protein [Pseudovibrio sp. Tun.PSC04-5.I4]SDQ75372.1 2-hydroxychromene-2-carboxylate isomerase [Pseudovibrio sp. Tun.PSC04-5.I4]
MSVRSMLKSRIAEYITSESRVLRKRRAFEKQRRRTGADHEVHYFHDAADPYAHLTLQVLGEFQNRYAITLKIHLISGPPDWAAPERSALEAYALVDSMRLAEHYGLAETSSETPSAERVARAETLMSRDLESDECVGKLLEISSRLWSGDELPSSAELDAERTKEKGDARLAELGHYLGATFYYGGEWYWGVDRFQYLEDRLQKLGLSKAPNKIVSTVPRPLPSLAASTDVNIDFFLSFRSPYSYLAFDRACTLSDRVGGMLNIRPVLPMVMRGLPVPSAKRKYILSDAAREARFHGIPFGRICDPLGKAIERGYSLLEYADSNDRLKEFCGAFMTGVWSQGIDASSDRGLSRIVSCAGLDWNEAKDIVDNDDWRVQVEANRQELVKLGLWGVPSFRVGTTGIWGQDRLWVMEDPVANSSAFV